MTHATDLQVIDEIFLKIFFIGIMNQFFSQE